MRFLSIALVAACAEESVPPPFAGLPTPSPIAAELRCDAQRECGEWGCWVTLCGASWEMGSPEGVGEADESPRHPVEQPSFRLQETELTLPAWSACVAAGACFEYEEDAGLELCNREVQGDDPEQPINCIDWDQAEQVCAFVGGRLPSEAEWEFAARNRGTDDTYPWGDAEPTPELVVLDWDDGFGSEPVCSLPAGNSEQGLCDLAGNVLEWTEDWYYGGYYGAPPDGSAWIAQDTDFKVMRGGGTGSGVEVRGSERVFHEPHFRYPGLGVRCAR